MKIPRRRILAAMSSSTRPTKVGLATRPPISPGLSRVTDRRETAAVRRQRPKMGNRAAPTYDRCRIREGPT